LSSNLCKKDESKEISSPVAQESTSDDSDSFEEGVANGSCSKLAKLFKLT